MAAAAAILEVFKEDTETSLADLFTYVLPIPSSHELPEVFHATSAPRFPFGTSI